MWCLVHLADCYLMTNFSHLSCPENCPKTPILTVFSKTLFIFVIKQKNRCLIPWIWIRICARFILYMVENHFMNLSESKQFGFENIFNLLLFSCIFHLAFTEKICQGDMANGKNNGNPAKWIIFLKILYSLVASAKKSIPNTTTIDKTTR